MHASVTGICMNILDVTLTSLFYIAKVLWSAQLAESKCLWIGWAADIVKER